MRKGNAVYFFFGRGAPAATAPPVAVDTATAAADEARYQARATPADLTTCIFAPRGGGGTVRSRRP